MVTAKNERLEVPAVTLLVGTKATQFIGSDGDTTDRVVVRIPTDALINVTVDAHAPTEEHFVTK
jgi:hypothetical protein